MWMTRQLSVGSGVRVHTHTAVQSCAEVMGVARLSRWPSVGGWFPFHLSLILAPQAAHIEPAQISTVSLQCAV